MQFGYKNFHGYHIISSVRSGIGASIAIFTLLWDLEQENMAADV